MKPSMAPSTLPQMNPRVDSLVRGAEAQLLGMTAPPGAFRRELDAPTQLARINAAIEQLTAARNILSPTESVPPLSGATELITLEAGGRSWIGDAGMVSSYCNFQIEVVGADCTFDLIGDFSALSFGAPLGSIASDIVRSDRSALANEIPTKTGA